MVVESLATKAPGMAVLSMGGRVLYFSGGDAEGPDMLVGTRKICA